MELTGTPVPLFGVQYYLYYLTVKGEYYFLPQREAKGGQGGQGGVSLRMSREKCESRILTEKPTMRVRSRSIVQEYARRTVRPRRWREDNKGR